MSTAVEPRTEPTPPPADTGEQPDAEAPDARWHAVMNRDRAWDGAFVYAVTSTRIYCRPSCPSRKPSTKRLRYYRGPAAAAADGYRACKRCRPDEAQAADPRFALASEVLRLISGTQSYTLEQLATITGVSRSHLQRVFTEIVGASPLALHTQLKVDRMRTGLSVGKAVATAAFDAGFASLPSAYEAASRYMGMTPGELRKGAAGIDVRYRMHSCALGEVLVVMTNRGVCRVVIADDISTLEAVLQEEYPNAHCSEMDDAMSQAVDAIVRVAAGHALASDVPLDLRGTVFQQRVWNALRKIPRGSTLTYAALATVVESPGAVRAVGSACGANPVALLIPCHRVLRSDGALGGYRWGLERKAALLAAEQLNESGEQELPR